MWRASSDLLIASLLACLGALAAALGLTGPVVPALLGLLLVLVLPGYALTAALLPQRALGWAERVTLTVALSLVSTMLGSLALNALSGGLRPFAWAGLLAAVTVGGCLIAWRRRRGLAPAVPEFKLNWVQGGTLGLAGLAVVAALALTRVPANPAGLEGYTVLWILPSDTTQPPGVRLGVNSMEFAPTEYRLLVTVDGRAALQWPAIDLGPGETWGAFAPLPNLDVRHVRVEATLYRLDNPGVVYRRVTLVQAPGVTP
jgi:hypothetical protein